MLFYILTILLGFFLDLGKKGDPRKKVYRKLFVLWLFIFLCFGYMTGSDWRDYEFEFSNMESLSDSRWINEMGFSFIFLCLKKLIGDYWLVAGILKCLFLYTFLRFLRKVTPYWLSAVSLLITGSLSFLLIDNPLRFMTALILVNVSMELCLNRKTGWAVALIILSFFIHNACIFFLILIPALRHAGKIYSWNKGSIVIVFFVVLALSTSVQAIENLRLFMVALAIKLGGNSEHLANYAVSSNSSFFTLGNLMSIIMFFVILFTRDVVVRRSENGRLIYGMAISFTILSKLFLIIPTGFRLAIPFGFFYMIYIVHLIRSGHLYSWIFIAYTSLSFPMSLWDSYKFIPYSNSIPYILTQHLDYSTRSEHNIEAYEKRTGRTYEGVYSE
ncbi:MAG: EpsG family protein [Bacteroidales bacterium]|nr:EpsG family protein [Bacteroidales bacterium]